MLLVTGASGFVGRRVVAALYDAGETRIRCLAHSRRPEDALPGVPVEVVPGDVRDPEALARALEGVQGVVHLVAIIRERRGGVTFRNVNHLGTANVARAAREAGVRHMVHVSAIGARPEPRYRYAHSKWLGEQEVIESGVPYTILRPSIQFGPGDEFLNTLAAVVKLFPLVPVAGNGRNRFQPIAVEDTARCVALAMFQERFFHRTVEIGGPRQYTYDQLIGLIIAALGARRLRVHVPVPVMRIIAGVMELALPRPPGTREQLNYLDLDNVAEVDSVEREFGFKPQALEEGLGYVRGVRLRDALAIHAGLMPRHIRDH